MKNIIIVGASSGIGKELAIRFIRLGWKVGVAARRISALDSLREISPENVYVTKIDVTEDNSADNLHELIERMGGMDVYLHCAGILADETEVSPHITCQVAETNAVGFARLVSTAFEYFRKSGRSGQIAAISSIAGVRGLGDLPAYSASKAFDSAYLEALRQKAHGLKLPLAITDIKPGWTRTPLLNLNRKYLLEMNSDKVTDKIFRAILKQKKTAVIGLRWKVLTTLERLVPTPLWMRLHLPLWKDSTNQ